MFVSGYLLCPLFGVFHVFVVELPLCSEALRDGLKVFSGEGWFVGCGVEPLDGYLKKHLHGEEKRILAPRHS